MFLGPPYDSSTIHLAIGNENDVRVEQIPDEFTEFRTHNHRYRFHIANKDLFAEFSYLETVATRFTIADDADIIVHCDADVLFVNRFDELIDEVISSRGIYGVIAHGSPFRFLDKTPAEWWKAVSLRFCGNEINLPCRHSLQDLSCPHYYNYGSIIGDRQSWHTLSDFCYENYRDLYHYLPETFIGRNDSPRFFTMQVSLALALFRLDIPTHPLPEIYNFANDEQLAAKYPEMLDNIRVIHYLRTNFFDRDRIFLNAEETNRFLALQDLDPVSTILQQHVAKIIDTQGHD